MMPQKTLLLLLCVLAPLSWAEETQPEPLTLTETQLRPHVEYLGDAARLGRLGKGKVEAGVYIIKWFQKCGIEPLFAGDYVQDVPDLGDDSQREIVGQNIGAFVRGVDPKLRDELIIVNAHYDHLGVRNGVVYPGADDNTSGMAMLLELARHFSQHPPQRSIAFVAFDLEEYLLWGSRWFVSNPPWPLEKITTCLTADMIGRSLGGLELPTVFVLGSEHSPELREALEAVPLPEQLEVAKLGIDMIGTRSDYGPFRDQEIPFLFFSTGEHPDYHQPTDTVDRIDFPKLARTSTLILRVAATIANARRPPTWIKPETTDLGEAAAVYRVTEHLLQADAMGNRQLSNVQSFFVSQVNSKTKYIVKQQKMSSEERTWLVRMTQLLMLSVF